MHGVRAGQRLHFRVQRRLYQVAQGDHQDSLSGNG
jgi:hypothetical protein